MPNEWRLIVDGPVQGAMNMARDRAVQLACEQGKVPPTLCLYRWLNPTVTLGRFQSLDGFDLLACGEYGLDVVRRFTGGRGVLHDDELTYSVVASVQDGVPRGVAASYRLFSEALAHAYRSLGVDAALTERDRGVASSAACYLATSRADLSLGAMKLSGSAQVWHGSTVLQHGSFTISRNVEREARVFGLSSDEQGLLASKAATIEGVTGRRPTIDEIAEAVIEGFEAVFDVRLVQGDLTASEEESARRLVSEVRIWDRYEGERV